LACFGTECPCPAPPCGNDFVQPLLKETCDPPGTPTDPHGNLCREDCTHCGDGNVDSIEECDDGSANSDVTPDTCRTDCTDPTCGDGVIDGGEECDDGSANSDVTPDVCRTD
jgi:hypothetical protein